MSTTTFAQLAPWELEYLPYTSQDDTEIPNFRINDAEGDSVCETNENLPAEVQEANAWIIAAAPELLKALEAYVDYFDESYPGRHEEIRLAARDAIAKAKGTPL